MSYNVTHLTPGALATDPSWTNVATLTGRNGLLQLIFQTSSNNVRLSLTQNDVECIQLDLNEVAMDYAIDTGNDTAGLFIRCYATPCRWALTIPDPRGMLPSGSGLVVRLQGYGAGPAKQLTRGMMFWRTQ